MSRLYRPGLWRANRAFGLAAMAILLFAVVPRAGQAQTTAGQAGPRRGEEVRIWRSLGEQTERLRGVFTDWYAGALWLNLGQPGSDVAVQTGEITRLQVHRGRKAHKARGALIGMFVGPAIGEFLMYTQTPYDGCSGGGCSPGVGALFGILPGAALGGLLGAVIRTPRWVEVSPLWESLHESAEQLPTQPPGPRTGEEVRIWQRGSPEGQLVEFRGLLTALDADSLSLDLGEAGVRVAPLSRVTRVQARRGEKGHVLRGALIGFALGAAIAEGVVSDWSNSIKNHLWVGGVLGGLPGTLLGGLIGNEIKTPRWVDMPIPSGR